MLPTLIASEKSLGGQLQGPGPLGGITSIESTIQMFNKFVSTFIGILTLAAGLWFVFQIFIGAFGWLTAGSDKASLEGAQKRLTNAVIGLAIVVAAIFIIDLIGNLLGLDILKPGDFILHIWK